MGCRKTVTEKKLAANRLNAERSTGPRTERGKNTSKFNAVITGLFAKHVVIPLCDGEGSEEQFVALFADLRQEFQPVGRLEEFYVGEIAKSMWRLRRATCAEKGSVRRRKVPDIYLHLKTQPVIEKIQTYGAQPEDGIVPAQPKIDDQFLLSLVRHRELLEMALKETHRVTEEEFEDSLPTNALPPDSVINDIFRYEAAAQKRFDWALQKLRESQERRQKTQAPVSV